MIDTPSVYAFWWPRFERVARWFVEVEQDRSSIFEQAVLEEMGRWHLPDIDFTIKARADRIDRDRTTGALTIIDYKTGAVPTRKQAAAGYAPQLPLEAAIARQGGFKDIAAGTDVASLEFWTISGGDPAGEMKNRFGDAADAQELAVERLTALLKAFSDADTPYLSHPVPARVKYADFDHLARVQEWQHMVTATEGVD